MAKCTMIIMQMDTSIFHECPKTFHKGYKVEVLKLCLIVKHLQPTVKAVINNQ